MTLRALNLGMPPSNGGQQARLDWCVQALVKISRWSQTNPSSMASEFSVTNGVEAHSLDVSGGSLDDVKKVLGTVLTDMAKGGSKQT